MKPKLNSRRALCDKQDNAQVLPPAKIAKASTTSLLELDCMNEMGRLSSSLNADHPSMPEYHMLQDIEQPTMSTNHSEELAPSSQDAHLPNTSSCPVGELTVPSQNVLHESLPQSLMEYILKKCTNVTNENIQEIAEELFYSLSITQERCDAIEEAKGL